MEKKMETNDLPTCPLCGTTLPPGKVICWCCEHEPKLGIKKEQTCGKDSCEINFNKEE